MTSTGERTHDIVLFGATGFVGRLTAGHLARNAPDGARIALSPDGPGAPREGALGAGLPGCRLAAAGRRRLGRGPGRQLAAATRVVATTVGPYAKYGMPLVAACAAAGTHYCDLTGEVLFVRDAIDAYQDEAAAAAHASSTRAASTRSPPTSVSG